MPPGDTGGELILKAAAVRNIGGGVVVREPFQAHPGGAQLLLQEQLVDDGGEQLGKALHEGALPGSPLPVGGARDVQQHAAVASLVVGARHHAAAVLPGLHADGVEVGAGESAVVHLGAEFRREGEAAHGGHHHAGALQAVRLDGVVFIAAELYFGQSEVFINQHGDVLDGGLGVRALQEYGVDSVDEYLVLEVLSQQLVGVLGGFHLVHQCDVGIRDPGNGVRHGFEQRCAAVHCLLALAGD